MPVNFPPSSAPYAAGVPADTAPATRPQSAPAVGTTGNDREAIPDLGEISFRKKIPGSGWLSGPQVQIDAPPADTSDGAVEKGVSGKFISLLREPTQAELGGIDIPPPSNPGPAGNRGVDLPGGKSVSTQDVLKLLLAMAVDEFQDSMKEARADVQLKIADMETGAEEITKAAGDRLTAAYLGGFATITTGFFTMVSAGVNLRGTAVANQALDGEAYQGASSLEKSQAFTQLTSGYQGASGALQGAGSVSQGGLNVGQGDEEEKGAEEDAAKAEADKAVADDDTLEQTAASMRQEFLSVMQDFLDKEKGLEQSHDQTMMTLARNV
ncbi:MAG: hypothetical protein WDO56_30510 [Gammaproteobacteria bacterium]